MNDCVVANFILEKELPEVVGHLKTLGNDMCLNNVLFQWFDSLFAQNINEDIWFHTWDLMFLEGNVAIFKATLAIFRLMQNEIMETQSMDDLFPLLDRFIADIPPKKFLQEILKMKSTYELTTIEIHRKFFLQRTLETLEKSMNCKPGNKKKTDEECQIAWPICIKEVPKFDMQKTSVIRQFNQIKVDESFFEDNVYKKKKDLAIKNKEKEKNRKIDKDMEKLKSFKHLLIERRVHHCEKAKKGCLLKLSDENTFKTNYTKGAMFMLDIITPSKELKPEEEIADILQKVKTMNAFDIPAMNKKDQNKGNDKRKGNDSE